jgi:hypothetical protein
MAGDATKATFAKVSNIDHTPMAEKDHTRTTALQVNMREGAALPEAGNTSAV